ncbi:MAG: glycosyltransferase, partial [Candidatus Micrarchaeota archaeon]
PFGGGMMRTSIVIPTKNSGRTIGACLRSIGAQGRRDVEVIVVDAHSSDGTRSIARRHGALVVTADGTPPRARNIGFSRARGDIFISLDSDMVLARGLLNEISRKMDGDESLGALILPETGRGSGFLSRCKSLEKRCYLGDGEVEACRAFRRGIFLAAGGYDEGLHFGEDWELHTRIGGIARIGRTERAVMHDTGSLTFASSIAKAFRYGKSLPDYLSRRNARKIPAPVFIRHFRTLAKEPVHALGLLSIKAAEYAAAAAGFAVSSAERALC